MTLTGWLGQETTACACNQLSGRKTCLIPPILFCSPNKLCPPSGSTVFKWQSGHQTMYIEFMEKTMDADEFIQYNQFPCQLLQLEWYYRNLLTGSRFNSCYLPVSLRDYNGWCVSFIIVETFYIISFIYQ